MILNDIKIEDITQDSCHDTYVDRNNDDDDDDNNDDDEGSDDGDNSVIKII
jgi:hypothetical protein